MAKGVVVRHSNSLPEHVTFQFRYSENHKSYKRVKVVKCPCCLGLWGHGTGEEK